MRTAHALLNGLRHCGWDVSSSREEELLRYSDEAQLSACVHRAAARTVRVRPRTSQASAGVDRVRGCASPVRATTQSAHPGTKTVRQRTRVVPAEADPAPARTGSVSTATAFSDPPS